MASGDLSVGGVEGIRTGAMGNPTVRQVAQAHVLKFMVP